MHNSTSTQREPRQRDRAAPFRLARAATTAALLCVTLLSCATSPLGRSQLQLFDEAVMAEMGATAFASMQEQAGGGVDPEIRRYVDCVASRVVSGVQAPTASSWEIEVFADESPNAFALPGGKIGVHTGLLKAAQNQHQLATVIGHEVAHVIAEHGNERMSTNFAAETGLQLAAALAGDPRSAESQTVLALLGLGAQVGVLLPFSRAQETEADILGLEIMAKAGFDPDASVELWQNMAAQGGGGPPAFLSTHPGTEDRMRVLRERLPQARMLRRSVLRSQAAPDCPRP